MLNELDKELERRGHRFVRFADDAVIFCKSRKSAERTLENIIPYIEGKLFLKVNRAKTTVNHVSRIKYLGYAFYRKKGGGIQVQSTPEVSEENERKTQRTPEKEQGVGK